ncbi:MAG: hypothetical protein U0Q18_25450 [Bryobacteraceae bacterium]
MKLAAGEQVVQRIEPCVTLTTARIISGSVESWAMTAIPLEHVNSIKTTLHTNPAWLKAGLVCFGIAALEYWAEYKEFLGPSSPAAPLGQLCLIVGVLLSLIYGFYRPTLLIVSSSSASIQIKLNKTNRAEFVDALAAAIDNRYLELAPSKASAAAV